ncbi:prib protein [Colletotrichum asianum]|uniref:Prib protein n=1 Tax=Colletotrichum asianum TaxID=702518 RepID=A0A8H3WLA4_9PEZI|nr:prib protein [Colletotrichum asianum]
MGSDGLEQESTEAQEPLPQAPTTSAPEREEQQQLSRGLGSDGVVPPVHPTACFNCRSARQRCDRRLPCSRCIIQDRACRHPSGSQRGRKHGSVNKPDTVEKILARINESPLRSQVIAALLREHSGQTFPTTPPIPSRPHPTPTITEDEASSCIHVATQPHESYPPHDNHSRILGQGFTPSEQSSVVSPYHIMAAAAADMTPSQYGGTSPILDPDLTAHFSHAESPDPIYKRLETYFAPRITYPKDWQVLASQSIDSTLKLEADACDPITARLIDKEDVDLYWSLFFQIRNSFVGLLDPVLHTSEYVHSISFTLFSVVCAMGCGISGRARDRILYPTLLSIAEANVRWSIAMSVRSVELIQAIINLKYWSPLCDRHADDPYWLQVSYIAPLAREIGINSPDAVAKLVNAAQPDATSEWKERLTRNFERTWIYVFLAEKSFGITTGRYLSVSWSELPQSIPDWWRKPMTSPTDRMICGIIEIRGKLLTALGKHSLVDRSLSALLGWHSEAFGILETTRDLRCTPDGSPSSQYLPILDYYMGHSLLVLSATALKDMRSLDITEASTEISIVTERTFKVASRALNVILYDETLHELILGIQNNMYT